MNTLSPIQKLDERLSLLPHSKFVAFSAFCAQAAIRNIDVYAVPLKLDTQRFHDRIDAWFWSKLKSGYMTFDDDYKELEEQVVQLTHDLAAYPFKNGISPPPNSVMARESIFLFISACSFLAGQGKIAQFLTVLNNCVSCKIETYYALELGLPVYGDGKARPEDLYAFPIYAHAMADIFWAIGEIERDVDAFVSSETLDNLRKYANSTSTFVVDRPIYARG